MDNDDILFQRELILFQPTYYLTDIGAIYACPDGIYFDTPKKAVANLASQNSIGEQDNKWINWLFAQTVITTKLWIVLTEHGFVKQSTNKHIFKQKNLLKDPVATNKCLTKIKEITHAHDVPLLIIPIPHHYNPNDRATNSANAFEGLDVYFPSEITLDDYEETDHFNDQGYKKYADFVAQTIDSVLTNSP